MCAEQLSPQDMVGPYRDYYNKKISGKTFDAEKQFETTEAQEQVLEKNYKIFKEALRRLVVLEQRARVDRGARRAAMEMGSICGKIYAAIYEMLPADRQNEAIAEMDRDFQAASETYGVDLSAHIAGFKGELAGAILIQQIGLKVVYPPLEQDLKFTTDWQAIDENGQKYLIQLKTYSLQNGTPRNGTMPPPVIGVVNTRQDLNDFRSSLSRTMNTSSDEEADRVADLSASADMVRDNGAKLKMIPVICMLGSPEAPNSDINSTTARPDQLTIDQARGEFEASRLKQAA